MSRVMYYKYHLRYTLLSAHLYSKEYDWFYAKLMSNILWCLPITAVDLSAAVTPEAMLPILANPDIQAKLIPHLPEGESLPKTEGELRNTISTPQFKQVGWVYWVGVMMDIYI